MHFVSQSPEFEFRKLLIAQHNKHFFFKTVTLWRVMIEQNQT